MPKLKGIQLIKFCSQLQHPHITPSSSTIRSGHSNCETTQTHKSHRLKTQHRYTNRMNVSKSKLRQQELTRVIFRSRAWVLPCGRRSSRECTGWPEPRRPMPRTGLRGYGAASERSPCPVCERTFPETSFLLLACFFDEREKIQEEIDRSSS